MTNLGYPWTYNDNVLYTTVPNLFIAKGYFSIPVEETKCFTKAI
jgi:hypothetical protein